METKEIVLGLVGSPNREGRTHQLVKAALEGANRAGMATELIQMADHVVAACKDCLPWVCLTNQKCTYEDDAFEFLSQKVLNCGALVLGTPVYWWDTSGLVKYFILKMFRVFARSAPLQGLPAVGLGIAGGTGNGLISGLRPVYHFFQMMQMRAIEPLPATRFNFQAALERAGELGQTSRRHGWAAQAFFRRGGAPAVVRRAPVPGFKPRGGAAPPGRPHHHGPAKRRRSKIAAGLVRADALAASGRLLESLTEVTGVYEAGVKAFEGK